MAIKSQEIDSNFVYLYIKNLPKTFEEQGLGLLIKSQSGYQPLNIQIIYKRNKSNNYAIVQLAKLSEALQVIKSLHKNPLYNLNVTLVDISNPKVNSILKFGHFRVVSKELELYQKNTYRSIASIMSMFSSKLNLIENLIKILSSSDEECSICHDQAGIDHVHFIANEGIVINPFENVPTLIKFLCSTCSQFASAICTGCERAFYCSKKCQLQNWKEHSKICPKKLDANEKNFKNTLEELKEKTNNDSLDCSSHSKSNFSTKTLTCNMDSSINEKANGLKSNGHDCSKEDNSSMIGGDIFSQLKSENSVEKLALLNNTYTSSQSSKPSISIPRMPQNDKIVERIPKAQYPLLDGFKAVVPYGESPSSFFVSSISDSKKAESITTRLGEICSTLSIWEGAKFLNSGDYCAALFEQDKLWYRAKVREKLNSKFLIQFIDYGNDEIVDLNYLRPLTAELAKVSPLAIHCSLNNIKSFPDETWSEDAITIFSNLVFDQGFNECKIFSIENELYLVDLFNSDGQSMSEVLIKKRMAICNLTQNTDTNDFETYDEVDHIKLDNFTNFKKTIENDCQDTVNINQSLSKINQEPLINNKWELHQESNALSSLKTFKKPICASKISAPIASFVGSLKLNDEISSVVHHILSRDTLEFMMLHNVNDFSKISEELNEELASVEESFGLCETGKIIAVKASDGDWYRAFVLSCEENKQPNVLLIDAGFCEPALKYFPLHPKHHIVPSQLGAIKPLKAVDSKIFDSLEKCLLLNQPQPFIGKVTSIKSDSIIITGIIGDIQTLEYEVKPYTWIAKRCTKNKIETKLSSKFENTTNLNDDSSVVEFKHSLSGLDNNYTLFDDLPKSIDYMTSIPRQKLKVKTHKSIPLYQDPEDNSIFYILGNNELISKVMNEFTKIIHEPFIEPSIGSYFLVQNEDDGEFYRSLVLGMEKDQYKVYYIDFGNIGYSPSRAFKECPASILPDIIPAQAVRCKAKCSDTDNFSRKLAAAIENGNFVTINILSEAENEYLVQVHF